MAKIDSEEMWAPLSPPFYFYLVSNLGRVRSVERIDPRGRYRGKILSPGKNSDGYLTVNLLHAGQATSAKVHRLVALAFIPNPLSKKEVNHRDGVKTNNHHTNLEWVTSSENAIHAYELGLRLPPTGESNGRSKITRKGAEEIRRLLRAGITQTEVARRFNLGQSTVSSIWRGKLWR